MLVKRSLRIIAKILFTVGLILAMIQLLLLRGTTSRAITATNRRVKYSTVPTLLIPGWGGNTWTYTKLINYYQDHNVAFNALIVRVAPTGRVRVSGKLKKDAQNPLIQVLYDWNYSVTYQPQVRELCCVLEVLHNRYHISHLNVIAHSYGGTELLHAYIGSPYLQREIDLEKVVFLGVPVDESFGTNTKYTAWLFKKSRDQLFKKLERQVKTTQLPRNLVFYNWMGSDEGAKTDGSVPQVQSLMLKTLVRKKHVAYHQRVYKNTTHSQLHQRIQIIKNIQQVLWGKVRN